MIDLNQFETKHFVVPCQTGVFADAANGKRLVFDDDEAKYVLCKEPTQYVKKKTLETYRTSVCVMTGNHLHFAVLKSHHINKHGLQWELEFEAVFCGDNPAPVCSGRESIQYWLFEEGTSLLTPDLLIEKNQPLNVVSCVSILLNSTLAKSVPLSLTPLDFVKHLSQGTLESLLNPIKQLAFGVEIEFTGITRNQAIRVVSKLFNTDYSFDTAYKVIDDKQRTWKIVCDGSIMVERNDGDNIIPDRAYKCELVTPILFYDDIPTLQQIVRELRFAGMKVYKSCGIHVHVAGSYFTYSRLRCLINLMADIEPSLYKSLQTDPERQSKWCRPVSSEMRHAVNDLALTQESIKTTTAESVKRCWYGGRRCCFGHYDSSRYHALNLHSLWEGKGIEYRMFNSTTHAGKVKAYIQLCLAITAYAKYRHDDPLPFIDENRENSSFRSWLEHIGLVGQEFKTARTHLLRNLKNTSDERRDVA